jgi:hypothetical protein
MRSEVLYRVISYYKRNEQFQHFIKPKLFKISTLNDARFCRETQEVCYSNLQLFDVCTLSHTAYINAMVEFLPNTR